MHCVFHLVIHCIQMVLRGCTVVIRRAPCSTCTCGTANGSEIDRGALTTTRYTASNRHSLHRLRLRHRPPIADSAIAIATAAILTTIATGLWETATQMQSR